VTAFDAGCHHCPGERPGLKDLFHSLGGRHASKDDRYSFVDDFHPIRVDHFGRSSQVTGRFVSSYQTRVKCKSEGLGARFTATEIAIAGRCA
jgi:hypothetical protein